jgi:hypothetical protein
MCLEVNSLWGGVWCYYRSVLRNKDHFLSRNAFEYLSFFSDLAQERLVEPKEPSDYVENYFVPHVRYLAQSLGPAFRHCIV